MDATYASDVGTRVRTKEKPPKLDIRHSQPNPEKRFLMNKFIHLSRFVRYFFDQAEIADKATQVIEGILKARSPRLSDIA